MKFYDFKVMNGCKSLILEYAERTSLEDTKKMNLNMEDKMKMIFEILIILLYIRCGHYIFRDLKPNDFIIIKDKTVILIDLD